MTEVRGAKCNACGAELRGLQRLDKPGEEDGKGPVFGPFCPCGEMTEVVWDREFWDSVDVTDHAIGPWKRRNA